MYVYASKRYEETPNPSTLKAKNRARLKLQREAIRYAADFMEKWTGLLLDGGERKKQCMPGVLQLREIVQDAEMLENDMDRRENK